MQPTRHSWRISFKKKKSSGYFSWNDLTISFYSYRQHLSSKTAQCVMRLFVVMLTKATKSPLPSTVTVSQEVENQRKTFKSRSASGDSHMLSFFLVPPELPDSWQKNRNNKNLYAQTGAPTFSPKEAVCSLLSEAVLSDLLPLFLLLPLFSLIVCHFYQLLIFYNFLLPYFLFSSIASSYVFLFLQVFAHKRLPKS